MTIDNLLNKIDSYRAMINGRRPLTPAEVRELDQYYKIGTTYASNALEGNSLTLTETKVLIEDGITVGGKPVKDLYEATGHAKAYDFMLTAARSGNFKITEDIVKKLHYLFYSGVDGDQAGRYRDYQVFITGTEYVPPAADDVPSLMKDYIIELNVKAGLHPVLFAAYAHRRLVDIHPFADGNGRTARLVMNLVLVSKGYCIISIPPVLRHDYISALMTSQRAENPTDGSFNRLIAECEIEAQREYCRMFSLPWKELEKKPSINEQIEANKKKISEQTAGKSKKQSDHDI